MKILYITCAKETDYLNDTVFHGLVELYKDDIIDSNYLWYLSKTNDDYSFNWGYGFTVCNNLYVRDHLDRSNLEEKISQRYFDIIIYGSIHRDSSYYDLVVEKYNENEIVILDGEDYLDLFKDYKKGLYFKREFSNDLLIKNIFPISFSIPKSKFMKINKLKTYFNSPMDPRYLSSYVYNNEEDYYMQYNESYFGFTTKKGGWDCMRHYEIVAAGCLPYFHNIQYCPINTMTTWPKKLQYDINKFYNKYEKTSPLNTILYYKLLNNMYEYGLQHFKTTDTAFYILSKL